MAARLCRFARAGLVAGVALKSIKPVDRSAAVAALVKTLDRLTHDAKDASRTARLEILQRLTEFAPPDATGLSPVQGHLLNLENSLRDFDPFVATAVAVLDDRDVILVEQVSVCRD